jgi:glyoxylase-like metal-dependent hydrolase (beta-lactamase superfamily II)
MTGTGWREVANGVFHRRYDPLDVSVCAVRGVDGLLLVDTRSSHREADEIRRDLRELGGSVRWVVNTHAHFDHSFGNYRFGRASDVGAVLYGHERVPAHLAEYEAPLLAGWLERGDGPVEHLDEVVITPPERFVGDFAEIDLGDRSVELLHLGRGHTDNDIVVRVPDASAWLLGDLIEESGPPMYGSGSFPLEWPQTVERLCARLEHDAILIPGHGAPVDAHFAARQQRELEVVASLIRGLHDAGVPADEALLAGADRWPFPPQGLASAVRDAYRQLGTVANSKLTSIARYDDLGDIPPP